jgi:hypothetical protein
VPADPGVDHRHADAAAGIAGKSADAALNLVGTRRRRG